MWDIITNKEAIQVNQIWDGHPGAQVLHSIGSNAAVEVWTKPLGEGRVAAFFLNTLNSGSQNDTVTVTVVRAGGLTAQNGVQDMQSVEILQEMLVADCMVFRTR